MGCAQLFIKLNTCFPFYLSWCMSWWFGHWFFKRFRKWRSRDQNIFGDDACCWKQREAALVVRLQWSVWPFSHLQLPDSKTGVLKDGWIKPWALDDHLANFERNNKLWTTWSQRAVAAAFTVASTGTPRVEESSVWNTGFSWNLTEGFVRRFIFTFLWNIYL